MQVLDRRGDHEPPYRHGILGGIKSIGNTCTKLVPFMAVFLYFGRLVLLAIHADTLPETVALIIKAPLRVRLPQGICRGGRNGCHALAAPPGLVFQHPAWQRTHRCRRRPNTQPGTTSTGFRHRHFWDTVVICLLTGFVVVNSGKWMMAHDAGKLTHMAFQDLG